MASSGRGVNNKGRSKKPPKSDFMSLPRDLMRTPAYVVLSPRAKAVLCFLAFSYIGRDNGRVMFGARDGEYFGMRKSNVATALAELERAGFIAASQRGSFGWKRGVRTAWRLTWRPSGARNEVPPTRDYERFKAPTVITSDRPRKKITVRNSGPVRPPEGTVETTSIGGRPLCRTIGSAADRPSSARMDRSCPR